MKTKHSVFPKGKFTLLTTNQEFDYAEYVEYCEMNNIEPQGENSPAFYAWCGEETYENNECDLYNIKSLANKIGDHFVITGKLGLWNGNFDIEPLVMHTLDEAIRKCINSCDYFDVTWENGVVEVSASHHDGTNVFEIHALSAKGIKDYRRAHILDETMKVKDYTFKRIPHPYYIY